MASSLAYGRVAQILRSVRRVLDALGPHPRHFLLEGSERLPEALAGFKHRFTTSEDVVTLLARAAQALQEHGSLEELLRACLAEVEGRDLLPALDRFADALWPADRGGFPLIAAPRDGSACKRLFLFLKWMVRHDGVDPGGWTVLGPEDLIMPVDTHIHAIAARLGLTARKQADLRSALEITDAFRRICPRDPTRYDFVLTRFGIRSGMSEEDLTAEAPR